MITTHMTVTDLDVLCYRAFMSVSLKAMDELTTQALLTYPEEFLGHSFDSARAMIDARGSLLRDKVRIDSLRARLSDQQYVNPFDRA